MKTIKVTFALTLLFALCSIQVNAQDKYLTPEQTPEQIKNFVSTHFKTNIVKVKQETKISKTEYEVKLADGTELEFDGKFSITEIETDNGIPGGLIPATIEKYVSSQYPGTKIVEWKLKRNGQKTELNNDYELYFDKDGNFKRADK